jgi:hypothetical protein
LQSGRRLLSCGLRLGHHPTARGERLNQLQDRGNHAGRQAKAVRLRVLAKSLFGLLPGLLLRLPALGLLLALWLIRHKVLSPIQLRAMMLAGKPGAGREREDVSPAPGNHG